MNGKDHFLVGGRPTWDYRQKSDDDSDWGNKFFFLPAAQNMSILLVESSLWNSDDFAIPYPNYFHPSKDSEVFTWEDWMTRMEQKWLFCFVGAPHPNNPKSVRNLLIGQNVCIEQRLNRIDPETVKTQEDGEEVISLIPRLIYVDPDSKLETLEDAFDVSLKADIHKVTRLRQDMIDGRTSDYLVEEYSWKYALLEQGDDEGACEWDNGSADCLIRKLEHQT
ncbi:hypothetical protein SSX86_030030 [Deinandra increscens subsp. villosa]|uniref:Exostosin GT47 domain-containing protein n=1 Tax=Deinandra increscens subsp. villosa TaxID=3103831 RepID=A0AAP0CB92_9ASTR